VDGKSVRNDSLTQEQIITNAVAPCPVTTVMVNGKPIKCLIDTGSEVSTLTESWYKSLKADDEDILDTTGWMKIHAANELQVPYLGYAELEVSLGDLVLENVGFLITKDSESEYSTKVEVPGVIGANVLTKLQSMPEAKSTEFAGVLNALDLTVNPGIRTTFAKVAGSKIVKIPSWSTANIRCTMGSIDNHCSNLEVLVQGLHNSSLPRGLIVLDTCTVVSNNQSLVRVMNASTEDIWLQPRQRLGLVRKADIVAPSKVIVETRANEIYVHTADADDQPTPELLDLIDVNKSELSKDEVSIFYHLIKTYSDVFSTSDDDIGFTNTITHKINLTDDIPVKMAPRRVPPHQVQEVKDHLRKLLEQKIIRPSTSPYCAPVVLVRKPDGSLRLCSDTRGLNSKTIKEAYPLPRIDDALDSLQGAKYFSSLDLAQGYYQVPIAEEDCHKTAFSAGVGGLFEYQRMAMGLCNSPATFQRLMEACLGDKQYETLLLYLDDILVFSKTFHTHMERLQIVFERLRQHGLKLKAKKCHFFKSELKYLGHIVSAKGIATDPLKIDQIQNWPEPQSENELRSFLLSAICSPFL
jgi:hypothetical protein